MKIYDLSQPLNADCSFWPFYPPFEVKYIKRKSEHGVDAQYIQTSNHMGTHLDAPRHFVTSGKTIDQIPIEWCYGPGVIVDARSAVVGTWQRAQLRALLPFADRVMTSSQALAAQSGGRPSGVPRRQPASGSP